MQSTIYTKRSRLWIAFVIVGILPFGWITRIGCGYIADDFLDDATYQGNVRSTDLALFLGANPCLENEYHVSVVSRAAGMGQYEIVKILLQHGANPEARNYRGETALDGVTDPRILALLQKAVQERKK